MAACEPRRLHPHLQRHPSQINELSLEAGVKLDPRTRGAYVDEHYMTNIDGIFAAGNVLHVHDLVDYVSLEAERLAAYAASYIKDGSLPPCPFPVACGENAGHVLPQRISGTSGVQISLRVREPLQNCRIVVMQADTVVIHDVFGLGSDVIVTKTVGEIESSSISQ